MTSWNFKAVDRADVYKAGQLVASLDRSTGPTLFSYLPEHLADGGPAVASTLPLSDEPVVTSPGSLPPFFAGLLPEGRRLTAIRSAVKTSPDDEFSLLLAVGEDMVGDVQVVPIGEDPSGPGVVLDQVGGWDEVTLADLFAQSIGANPDRTAIAGVQDKISGRMISLPYADASGDWILKLDPPEFRHLVLNEAFFLERARRAGIKTVAADVVTDSIGAHGLKVQRFDRDGVARLAVEDGCQALDLYPADKYRTSTEALINALASICSAPTVATYEMFRMWVFAYLTGNGDLHAKNLSVVWNPSGQVSPAYDLPSTFFYGDTTVALPVNGSTTVSKRTITGLVEAIGLRPAAASRALGEVSDSVQSWLDDLEGLPFSEQQLTKFTRFVKLRLRTTA